MACNLCRQTDCILATRFVLKDGTIVFADLRFDMDFNQLDINYGTLTEKFVAKESDWSDSVDIKYCPFCGKKLPKVD